MAPQARPRGRRLPARVYWTRRAVVVVIALALVFGIAKLIGGTGSDTAAASDQASTTGSTPSSGSLSQGPSQGPVAPTQQLQQRKSTAPLLAPSGDCQDDEVSALPMIKKAYAGGQIAITVRLEGTQPACTFEVSPESLVLKIASGNDRIWSTQDCPQAISPDSVVVRSGVPTDVRVTWSGRRSDDTCGASTTWALPGFYHVYAAALGSAPADVQFEVTLPHRRVITRTAKPHATATPKSTATPQATATPKSSPKPHPSASKPSGGSACGGDNAAGTC